MVGGKTELIEECGDIFSAMGSRIFKAGKLGAGKSTKMINQFLNAANTCAAAEAFYLAESLGLDAGLLLDIVNQSSGSSWVSQNNVSKHMLTGEFGAGFRLSLMAKDVRLFMEQADTEGVQLPIAKHVHEIFCDTLRECKQDSNYNIVSCWIRGHNDNKI